MIEKCYSVWKPYRILRTCSVHTTWRQYSLSSYSIEENNHIKQLGICFSSLSSISKYWQLNTFQIYSVTLRRIRQSVISVYLLLYEGWLIWLISDCSRNPPFLLFFLNLLLSLSCTFVKSMDLLNIYFKNGNYNSVQIKQKHFF